MEILLSVVDTCLIKEYKPQALFIIYHISLLFTQTGWLWSDCQMKWEHSKDERLPKEKNIRIIISSLNKSNKQNTYLDRYPSGKSVASKLT